MFKNLISSTKKQGVSEFIFQHHISAFQCWGLFFSLSQYLQVHMSFSILFNPSLYCQKISSIPQMVFVNCYVPDVQLAYFPRINIIFFPANNSNFFWSYQIISLSTIVFAIHSNFILSENLINVAFVHPSKAEINLLNKTRSNPNPGYTSLATAISHNFVG